MFLSTRKPAGSKSSHNRCRMMTTAFLFEINNASCRTSLFASIRHLRLQRLIYFRLACIVPAVSSSLSPWVCCILKRLTANQGLRIKLHFSCRNVSELLEYRCYGSLCGLNKLCSSSKLSELYI